MSPLKVAVFGATGRIGGRVMNLLIKSDAFAPPMAVVRKKEQVELFKDGATAAVTSIVEATVAEIANTIKGYDAVVFAAANFRAGGESSALLVDLDGCNKVVDACKLANVKRFVLISAVKAQDRDFWDVVPGFKPYYIIKNAADQYVFHSDLDYTVIQPGWFNENKGTGKMLKKQDLSKTESEQWPITMDDVALSVTESLQHPESTTRKVITLSNGDTPMAEAFKTF
ncbi:hypothetical protein TPHA_0G03120 [Tetrapisispora phaffii CBS 4417]|uniref:NAD(P)-binding domain-containing protein n=1 Tax=Tetrapisispora phaffii (strain ATCC 24235 / CBS 4417 / NBRC 1672 / NRRL Y-8282 / UCD 70-5) TaxID=1071381 RepID=G8BW75_TETPH|nr:hypothetical protein TPHA_0G03120 [Tetrapisispora phaffii CBS 4417]CCE64153.1 hypothetical protein TPHA_0G03120 [Tetrapisispora phaffii CBS 4417]